jgi:hypothetical protein
MEKASGFDCFGGNVCNTLKRKYSWSIFSGFFKLKLWGKPNKLFKEPLLMVPQRTF